MLVTSCADDQVTYSWGMKEATPAKPFTVSPLEWIGFSTSITEEIAKRSEISSITGEI